MAGHASPQQTPVPFSPSIRYASTVPRYNWNCRRRDAKILTRRPQFFRSLPHLPGPPSMVNQEMSPLRAFTLILCIGMLRGAGLSAAGAEILRIADVQGMPRSSINGSEVVVGNAVVTWIQLPERSKLTIQDGPRGMWVSIAPESLMHQRWQGSQETLDRLAVGDSIEIEGELDPGGFAPKLLARDMRRCGSAPIPAAIESDDERFFSGADECCRITTEGVVQGFRQDSSHWLLQLERGGRRFEARVPRKAVVNPSATLVDGTVRLTGVAVAAFNARGELLHPRIMVMGSDDVTVVTPPPRAPFEAGKVPLSEIATFKMKPDFGHRLRTQGVVNYVFSGGFFIQDGPSGIRVETADPVAVAINDHIEVAGFLDRRRHAAGLQQALVRIVGQGVAHEPLEVTPAEILERFEAARRGGTMANPGDCDGCLVSFPARVADVQRTPEGGRFLLASADVDVTVMARMDPDTFAHIGWIRPDSMVNVTGLLQIEAEPPNVIWSELAIKSFTIGLRSPRDVQVLVSPSWWTARRLTTVVAGLSFIFVASLAWVAMLQRQVRRQAARITLELQGRRDAAVEFYATLRERSRLAANLHDTVLQTLAGVLLQLDVCRRSLIALRDDAAGSQLDVAARMVHHAATDLRGSVWALRTQPMAGRSFTESLAAMVQHFSAGDVRRITFHSDGSSFLLPKFVAGNLLLVIQEAIRNAYSHADPSTVDLFVNYDLPARTVTVTVQDDGRGFAVGHVVGAEQGHFGLQCMRERVEALGGVFSVTSEEGVGTTVTATVVVQVHDAKLDEDSSPPPVPDMSPEGFLASEHPEKNTPIGDAYRA